MEIISLKGKLSSGAGEVITRDYLTNKIIPNKDGIKKYSISSGGGNGMLGYLVQRKQLDGDFGINSLIHYLKNIKITEDELAIRDKLDSDISKYSGPDENGIYHPGNYIGETPHWTWVMNNPEYYTDEEISGVPYLWGGEGYEARHIKILLMFMIMCFEKEYENLNTTQLPKS